MTDSNPTWLHFACSTWSNCGICLSRLGSATLPSTAPLAEVPISAYREPVNQTQHLQQLETLDLQPCQRKHTRAVRPRRHVHSFAVGRPAQHASQTRRRAIAPSDRLHTLTVPSTTFRSQVHGWDDEKVAALVTVQDIYLKLVAPESSTIFLEGTGTSLLLASAPGQSTRSSSRRTGWRWRMPPDYSAGSV